MQGMEVNLSSWILRNDPLLVQLHCTVSYNGMTGTKKPQGFASPNRLYVALYFFKGEKKENKEKTPTTIPNHAAIGFKCVITDKRCAVIVIFKLDQSRMENEVMRNTVEKRQNKNKGHCITFRFWKQMFNKNEHG